MKAGLTNTIAFHAADPRGSLGELPEAPAVFALCAADPGAEPYLSKTPNLRRRLMRFLRGPQSSAGAPSRRLQLAHMVDHIEYSVTGSEFESSLCLYEASLRAFGERARKRLRLRPCAFLRMSMENAYPRVYATTKISKRTGDTLFGPFPSRPAAERFADEMLNLFLLRRCFEELNPDPKFPGCVYSEMKMCLAPCYQGCSDERYKEEAAAVLDFLSTRGGSMLAGLERERNAASEAMEFERAAALHQRMQKVQTVIHLASEAVRPLAQLSGVLVQPSAHPDQVALFGLTRGVWTGPALYSILGMRLANERSGSSSLFSHPMAVEAIPLEGPAPSKDVLETRLEEALGKLANSAPGSAPGGAPGSAPGGVPAQTLMDHVALFAQWFYRAAGRSVGEMLFIDGQGVVPRKPLLRAISRVAARANTANPEELSKPPIQWHA